MKHLPYPSITNHYQGKFIDKIKIEFPKEINEKTWIVTEKVHGSNYSFWVDYYSSGSGYVRAAKRTDFINKNEKFFNHEEVFERLNFRIFKMVKEELKKDFVIFGELFGGNYGGVSKGKMVQRGVQYHPHNDFLAFDMASYSNGSPESLTFLSHDRIMELCDKYNIPHVPILFEGTLQECIDFNNDFVTKVPELYGLDHIDGNICEGTIIKPKTPLFLKSGERVIIKNKNEKFKELTHAPKSKVVPSLFNDAILTVIGLISTGLTENRMDAIISKHGDELPFGEAMKLLLEDSVADTCKEAYAGLDDDEKHIVNKYMNKDIANIVKKKIVLKKKAG